MISAVVIAVVLTVVVGRIVARDRDPVDVYGLARTDVLVSEVGCGVGRGQQVTSHAVVRQGYRGGGVPVVDLVVSCGCDCQSPRCDRQVGADEREVVVAASRQSVLNDRRSCHILTRSRANSPVKLSPVNQRTGRHLIGQYRIGLAVDLSFGHRR